MWTAPIYRLYSIDDRHPEMFEVEDAGVSVVGELYHFGILYPRSLADGHRDISAYAGWRAYWEARGVER